MTIDTQANLMHISKAEKIAFELNKDAGANEPEGERWSYEVDPKDNQLASVRIRDEDGEVIGYL